MSSNRIIARKGWGRAREQAALVLFAFILLLVVLAIAATAIWPARTERQRRLLEALSRSLADDDWP